jgi:hypothetical protein
MELTLARMESMYSCFSASCTTQVASSLQITAHESELLSILHRIHATNHTHDPKKKGRYFEVLYRIGIVEAHDGLTTQALLLGDSRLTEIEVHRLRCA